MRRRHLGLFAAIMFALLPAPAQAQGDFIKDTLKDLIEKSGVYVSIGTRQSIDNDVEMGPSLGIGYATLSLNPRTGKKYPFSFSTYSGDLRTSDTRQTFGRFGAKQIMTGIGYQWVRGRMIYSTQFGVGYSFNNVDIESAASNVFNAPQGPVSVDVSNSWVLRPQLKAEYILHPKVSVRSQLSYTYTDPNVIVQTATSRHEHEWRPHHVKFDIGVGVFPFRK